MVIGAGGPKSCPGGSDRSCHRSGRRTLEETSGHGAAVWIPPFFSDHLLLEFEWCIIMFF